MANGHSTAKATEHQQHKAPATQKQSNLPTQSAPAFDYSEYAGKGFESQTRDDYALPFLNVLQSNSPQIETIAAAKPGQLINSVTNEIFDPKKGITFIPVDTQHSMTEWKPRTQGGGFVKLHTLDSDLVHKVKQEQEFGKYKTIKGDLNSNDLIETFNVYGILVRDDGSAEQVLMSFSSTKIKVYKRWMTKARSIQLALPDGRRINPPLFAHKYRITSVQEKNAKGSFYNFQVDYDGKDAEAARIPTNHTLFQQAVSFYELIKQGNIKAAHDTVDVASEAEDADVPFE